jgi:outer membrane protein OmpA-like peptidoglycan-associated protein
MLDKSSSGDTQTLSNLVQRDSVSFPETPLGFFGGDGNSLLNKGAGFLSSLFGNKNAGITEAISGYSGTKSSTTSSILAMVLPVILGLLRKHTSGGGANAISSLLNSQRDNIVSSVPAGLSLGNLFGNIPKISTPHVSSTTTTHVRQVEETPKKGMGWLMPLLLLLIGAAILWWFLQRDKKPVEETSTGITTDTSANVMPEAPAITAPVAGNIDSAGNYIYNPGNSVSLDLPNNAGKLEVGENSTEAKLVAFLNDNNAKVDSEKGNWFEFTNVRFRTGSAEITDESMTQLRNIVMIAKAYPAAKFKIGGYTDDTGDKAANVKLSQQRADAVASQIRKLGAPQGSITGAEGYGPEHPIGDNATEEGKAMNRRVAVNVKAK